MSTPKDLKETPLGEIRKQLTERRETPHFLIFYSLRTPDRGPGNGLMGVGSIDLIDSYAEALEATYQRLETEGWACPIRDPRFGRVPVYVFDASKLFRRNDPFTYVENSFSFIGLRSEIGEPNLKASLLRAKVDATHEVSHIFTQVHRPLTSSRKYGSWGWIDEATAVFIEWKLNYGVDEAHRFALHWINRPELPLELDPLVKWPGGYAAGWFISYLFHYKNFGWSLLRDIWSEPNLAETPALAIERCLRMRNEVFRDFNPRGDDVFGAKYCVDSYLIAGTCTLMEARYGEHRGITCSWGITPGEMIRLPEVVVTPLSCRYFRIFPENGTSEVTIEIESSDSLSISGLKATLLPIRNNTLCGSPIRLDTQCETQKLGTETPRLVATLATDTSHPDHIVLVVANLNFMSSASRGSVDASAFQLFLRAI